jgi:hypothetical protein
VLIQIQLSEDEVVAIIEAAGAIIAALIGGISLIRAARIQAFRPRSPGRQRRRRRPVEQPRPP